MEELVAIARQQLERVKALCAQLGLKYVELGRQLMGVGIAIGFGPADYVILAVVGGGSENQISITSGILKDIKQDRLAALEAANHFNQNNTAYPVYLHDAEIGWALIMQLRFPIELLLHAPEHFSNYIRGAPHIVIQYRSTIAERWDLEGQPWSWTEEDIRALFTRSML